MARYLVTRVIESVLEADSLEEAEAEAENMPDHAIGLFGARFTYVEALST